MRLIMKIFFTESQFLEFNCLFIYEKEPNLGINFEFFYYFTVQGYEKYFKNGMVQKQTSFFNEES